MYTLLWVLVTLDPALVLRMPATRPPFVSVQASKTCSQNRYMVSVSIMSQVCVL